MRIKINGEQFSLKIDTMKKIKDTFIILITTIVLLELVSFVVLKVHFFFSDKYQLEQISSKKTNVSRSLDIFEKNSKSGEIKVHKESVFPIKKNFTTTWVTDEFEMDISTNDKGLRENFTCENEEVDVAFFGDSFTFGHGVNGDERFSKVFADTDFGKSFIVVNYSYQNGFQSEHYEYYFRNNTNLKPKHVIVGLYLGNDLESDLTETFYDRKRNELEIPYRLVTNDGFLRNDPDLYKYPFRVLSKYSFFGTLVLKVIYRTKYRDSLFDFYIPNPPNSVSLETGKENLLENRGIKSLIEMDKLVKKRGGKLTVLLIPQNYFYSNTSLHIHKELQNHVAKVINGDNLLKSTRKVLSDLGIEFFDPSLLLNKDCYFKSDAHWTVKGHGIVGSALSNYISKE